MATGSNAKSDPILLRRSSAPISWHSAGHHAKSERSALLGFLESGRRGTAGGSRRDGARQSPPPRLIMKCSVQICRAIFNTNEFAYPD